MELTFDARALVRAEELYKAIGSKTGTVIARAVNYTGSRARTQVTRSISEQMGLPVRTVRGGIKTRPATSQALLYALSSRGKPLSLKYFKPVQTTEGVDAQVWGGSTTFPHAFIGGDKLHGGVFVRAHGGNSGKFGLVARLPIEKVTGPSIPDTMVTHETAKVFEATVKQYLEPRLAHELEFMFRNAGKSPP